VVQDTAPTNLVVREYVRQCLPQWDKTETEIEPAPPCSVSVSPLCLSFALDSRFRRNNVTSLVRHQLSEDRLLLRRIHQCTGFFDPGDAGHFVLYQRAQEFLALLIFLNLVDDISDEAQYFCLNPLLPRVGLA
jgi:hypothetical protein